MHHFSSNVRHQRTITQRNGQRTIAKSTAVLLGALATTACCYLRTPYLLKQLNSGASAPSEVKRPPIQSRIAKLVRAHMADSYFNPTTVGEWLSVAESKPGPLVKQLRCLEQARIDPTKCYRELELSEAPRDRKGAQWQLPPPPFIEREGMPDLPPTTDPSSQLEMDVQRFAANASWIGSSLLALQDVYGQQFTDAELTAGLRTGLEEARRYIVERKWHRDPLQPSVAVVMSGGGANGAFTAGFVWRLLESLDQCHHSPNGDLCPKAKVDLVVGTSTGSLIGVLLDMFHVPGQQARARQLLIDNYTCVTERDLYCVYSKYDSALAGNLRGLVRFDGIKQKLSEAIIPAVSTNATELVSVSVDFESGEIYGQSDQDPADATDHAGRVDAVLASIVEPVMAEPVDGLPRRPGESKRQGTFVDGGVRSAMPMLEVVRRGAERALVISTSSLEPTPSQRPGSALEMLMRTIDLSTTQSFSAEAHTAELEAVVRRMTEFNTCKYRLGVHDFPKERIEAYCKRSDLYATSTLNDAPQAASTSFLGPRLFDEVANSWKSTWIYRPEVGSPAAAGYSFEPLFMRQYFETGVRTFQMRCDETLQLFGVSERLRHSKDYCGMSVEQAIEHARSSFKPIDQCHPNDHDPEVCQ